MNAEIIIVVLRYGVIILLYIFLAFVLVTVFRDIKKADKVVTSLPDWGKLIVVESGKSGLTVGDAFSLETVNFFGRSGSNTIQLTDDFTSGRHALLAFRQKQWWIEDLGSTNGTLLNGRAIMEPNVVAFGDVIEIGRTMFRFEKA